MPPWGYFLAVSVVALVVIAVRHTLRLHRFETELRRISAPRCKGPHTHYRDGRAVRFCRESCTLCSGDQVRPCFASHP